MDAIPDFDETHDLSAYIDYAMQCNVIDNKQLQDDINSLVNNLADMEKKKKDEVAIFILRVIAYAKEHPELSVHQIIKDVKKERF